MHDALEGWRDLYVMLGGAAAALTGLVFVAISMHLRAIADVPVHRARARATLLGLTLILLLSALALFPYQTAEDFGTVLIIFGLAVVFTSLYLVRRSRQLPGEWDGPRKARAFIQIATPVVVALEGAVLRAGEQIALYLFAATMVASLGNFVSLAWSLMIEVSDDAHR